MDRQTYIQTDTLMHIRTLYILDSRSDQCTDRQTDKQTNRETDTPYLVDLG